MTDEVVATSTSASPVLNETIHLGVQLFRLGPLLVYMRFATLLFSKILLASHPNLSDRSFRYQRLVKRLILISALLLSMLIWLIETEFMGFFLKYVIKITPKLWIFPPRIITESFVALKLIALNGIINKYDSLESDNDSMVPIGYLALELSRIEDILVEFFENCELGRSGYLLVNPIRSNATTLLDDFEDFVEGRLPYKRRDRNSIVDDLATLPQGGYRSLNAKRSHSVNCIDDFRKFVSGQEKNYEATHSGGSSRSGYNSDGGGGAGGAREEVERRPFELEW